MVPIAFGVQLSHASQQIIFSSTATSDHHRPSFELRVAQQFHGRIKSIHVQVGDAAKRVRCVEAHAQSIAERRCQALGDSDPTDDRAYASKQTKVHGVTELNKVFLC